MKPTLTQQDFQDAADALGCEVAVIRAVCAVESVKGGFNPDDTPVTLFEGHKFYAFTKGAFAGVAPDLCYPKWTKQFYGKTWQAEQDRLQRAIVLERESALKSASWGRFQIMGFNHAMLGFATVEAFVEAMYTGEREHLLAFVAYVQAAGLAPALKLRNWGSFARGYNGPAYADNQYDTKLASAYLKAQAAGNIPEVAQTVPVQTPAPPATSTGGFAAFVIGLLKLFFKRP